MTAMTLFTLHDRCMRKGASLLGLSCDPDGLHLGDCALVRAARDAQGRRLYEPRALGEINAVLSAAYGREIEFASRMPGLCRVSQHLSEDKLALAQITALHLRLPDLPDEAAVERLSKAEALLRFNPNHFGPGPRHGQFAPAGESENGRDGDAPTRSYPAPAGDSIVRNYSPEEAAKLPPPPPGSKYVTLKDGSVVWSSFANQRRGGPMLMPDGVSLAANIRRGEEISDEHDDIIDQYKDMFDLFYRNRSMDYQRIYGTGGKINRDYIDFGNYNYGAVAAAAGLSWVETIGAAGLINLGGAGDKSGPLLNNPRNLAFIRRGFEDYRNGKISAHQRN